MTAPTLERARQLCLRYGGPTIDVWTLPRRVVARCAEEPGRSLDDIARDEVSAALVLATRSGDDDARERLLTLWHADVLRWCRFNSGRGVCAEDAAHDVLVRVLTHLGRVRDPSSFRAWLWSTTWRVLREHERLPRLRRWLFGDPPDTPDPRPAVDDVIGESERVHAIRQVLQRLALDDRLLLWQAYVEGRTRREIAATLGIAEGTLNRRLTAARDLFRAEAARVGLSPEADLVGLQRRTP